MRYYSYFLILLHSFPVQIRTQEQLRKLQRRIPSRSGRFGCSAILCRNPSLSVLRRTQYVLSVRPHVSYQKLRISSKFGIAGNEVRIKLEFNFGSRRLYITPALPDDEIHLVRS